MCYNRKIEEYTVCSTRNIEFNEAIDSVFKEKVGSLNYKVDALSPQTINNLLWNHDMGNLWSSIKDTKLLYNYAGTYYSVNGKRNAKRLGLLLARKARVVPEHRNIQAFLKEWAGAFEEDKYKFIISTSIEDFRLLGHTCDTNSCFNTRGRFSWSPIVLWSKFPSFVVFIKQEETIKARAWGVLTDRNDIIITNMYGRNLSMTIESLIDRIVFQSTGYKRLSGCRFSLGGIYHNGDEVGYAPQDSLNTTVTYIPYVGCVLCDAPGDVVCKYCEADVYYGEILECQSCHTIYPDYHILEHFDKAGKSHLFCDYGCAGENIKYCAACANQVLVSEMVLEYCPSCASLRGL